MAPYLEPHHIVLICQFLQKRLDVTFAKYGSDAGTQLQLLIQEP